MSSKSNNGPTKKELKEKKKQREEQSKEEEEFIGKLIDQNTTTIDLDAGRKLFYLLVAFLTTLLPIYLFLNVKNFEFQGVSIAVYVAVGFYASHVLSSAYHNLYTRMRLKLKVKYQAILDEAKAAAQEAEKEKLAELGATGYAICFTNVFYLLVFLFVSFYALKKVDNRMNYAISLIVASVFVQWFSGKTTSKKQ